MKPILPTVEVQYRRKLAVLPSLEQQLDELLKFTRTIRDFSPLPQEWFLTSDRSKEDALQHRAFDEGGAAANALALLREESGDAKDVRIISIWNGAERNAESIGLTSRCNTLGRPDSVTLRLRAQPVISEWSVGVKWLQSAITIWSPLFASFSPFWYNEKSVFKDRPGVGWMLYLPVSLTTKEIPEARALIPIAGESKKQQGTIIVSVTDGPFSDDNPEHIKIANAIEVRLADQDLLPQY